MNYNILKGLLAAILAASMLFTAEASADNPDGLADPVSGVVAITMGQPSYWRDDLPDPGRYNNQRLGWLWIDLLYYIRPDNSLWVLSNRPIICSYMMFGMDASQEAREAHYENMFARYGLLREDILHEKILDDVAYVSSIGAAVFALQTDGTLWAWGNPASGQLGIGDVDDWVRQPKRVMDNVASVHIGRRLHVFAITTDDVLWGWGGLLPGMLGDGTDEARWSPVRIMDDVKSITLGSTQTMAITNDGSLWSWGRNEFGQLGDGTTEDRLSPVKIMENVRFAGITSPRSGAGSWSLVRPAGNYSFAITNDDTLWAWGVNDGQIGDGTMEDRLYPVQILDNVRHAESFSTFAGDVSTFAITNDSELWAWGQNEYIGYLFDDVSNGIAPIKIKNNVSSVWAYFSTIYVIDNVGGVWVSHPDISRIDDIFIVQHKPFEHNPEAAPFVYICQIWGFFLGDDGGLWWGITNDELILPAGSVRIQ